MSDQRDEHREEDRSGRPVSGAIATESGRLLEVMEALWSRFCPECGARRPMTERTCPSDGKPLRDLTIVVPVLGGGESDLADLGPDDLRGPHCPFCGGRPQGEETVCPRDGIAYAEGRKTPEPFLPELPAILAGKWRVESPAACGAIAATFTGRHAVLGTPVRIDVLRPQVAASPEGLRALHQEAMELVRFRHPGIAKVLDYGVEGGLPFLVTEQPPGKPFHRFLLEGDLPIGTVVEVMRQTAEALDAAHRTIGDGGPLVHLDLKPENIVVEEGAGGIRAKLTGFGIAPIASAPGADPEGTIVGQVAGTLPYMAPERRRGLEDPQCDIYSLGVMLYEAIAGKKPFEVEGREALRPPDEREGPARPSRPSRAGRRLRLGIQELDRIALRSLEKKPDHRPANAREIARAIKAWQFRMSRPRFLSTRKVRIPFIAAFLLALTVYWGPCDSVRVDEPAITISPSAPTTIRAMVRGPGYGGGEASLVVEAGGVRREFPLGQVSDGHVLGDLKGKDVIGGLGAKDGRELAARVMVRGAAGRTVSSREFPLRIDDRPPRIVDVDGNLLSLDAPVRVLAKADGEKNRYLRILADEAIDPDRSSLNRKPGRLPGGDGDGRLVEFPLEGNETTVPLILADRMGNVKGCDLTLRWIAEKEVRPLISVALVEGQAGAADRPLHGIGCAARKAGGAVRFRYSIVYPSPFSRDLRAGDSDQGRPVQAKFDETEFSVDEEEIIRAAEGARLLELHLVMTDKADARIREAESVTVHIEPPLAVVDASPPSGPLPGGQETVEIGVRTQGSGGLKVLVDGKPAERDGDLFRARVAVAAAGKTKAVISASTARGCGAEEIREYWRGPVAGGRYLFAIDPDLEIDLRHLEIEGAPAGNPRRFWSVEGEAARKVLEGSRGAPGPSSSRGASRADAEKAGEWLTARLAKAGKIAAGEAARLPAYEEVQAILAAGGIPAAPPGRLLCEWVADRTQDLPAALAVVEPGGKLSLKRAEPTEDQPEIGFRLLIPYREEGSLVPVNAKNFLGGGEEGRR